MPLPTALREHVTNLRQEPGCGNTPTSLQTGFPFSKMATCKIQILLLFWQKFWNVIDWIIHHYPHDCDLWTPIPFSFCLVCQFFYTSVQFPGWRVTVSLDCVQMCKVLSSKFTSCWKKCRKGFTACNVEASSKCKYLVFVAFYFAKKSPNVYVTFVLIQCQSLFLFFLVKMVKKWYFVDD